MKRIGFGVLVGGGEQGLTATHVPFLVEQDAGGAIRLLTHLAAANDQWRSADGQPVMVVFQGPHFYVSPAWMRRERDVPTWNYVAVHAYGRARVIREPAALQAQLAASVAHFEEKYGPGWTLDELTRVSVERLATAIVGVEVAVERLEGKMKLSQNHERAVRDQVVAALEAHADPVARETARWMRESGR